MSSSMEPPWSNHPNAPQIPSWLYLTEREGFAGYFICAIAYGIVIALFFQCMGLLLSPTNSIRTTMRWALVVHTVAMFWFITMPIGIDFNYYSVTYINGRGYPGTDGLLPGPVGYSNLLSTRAVYGVFNMMYPLNQWLADGILLHRCYVVYSMNRWVIAFPSLMYLASIAMGIIAQVYRQYGTRGYTFAMINFNTSYYSICLCLNALLTLMIVARLIVHRRNLRRVLGTSDGASGLYTAIAAMIIESYALYAFILLTSVVSWTIKSWPVINLFSKVIGPIQVIAPYLIIIRVAKRRAVTRESISETAESICFKSQESTDGGGSLLDGVPTNETEVNGEAFGKLCARDENAIEEVSL